MITNASQRWKSGRSSYRPIGEPIRTAEFSVEPIQDDTSAKAFVVAHHYSASYPAARTRFGLYHAIRGLAGVAVFSVPQNPRALDVLPGGHDSGIELGRFILLDDVPANGETWFLARCFELLRADGYMGVISFADPVARTTTDGTPVFPGHIGTIYQAHNAVYLGTTKAERKRLLDDGTVIPGRALAKIRKRDKGWRYAAGILESRGASPLGESDDAVLWLDRWLARLTRPLQHSGNHKYAWALHAKARRRLPVSWPYPKIGLGQVAMFADHR